MEIQSADWEDAYTPLKGPVDALNGQTVGSANVRLEGDRQIVRRNETNLVSVCSAGSGSPRSR